MPARPFPLASRGISSKAGSRWRTVTQRVPGRRLSVPSPPLPATGTALEARCQILFEHGHPSEAEAALRALIDCQPEDAVCVPQSGHVDAALEAARRGGAVVPAGAAASCRMRRRPTCILDLP